jgi:hypothetical protein
VSGFVDRLRTELSLRVKDKEFTFAAGNIKRLSVEVLSHGFTATVEWWVVCQQKTEEDTLFEPFQEPDLMEATLTLDRAYDTDGGEAEPLRLQGLVRERWVHERAFEDVQGQPVLQRRYRVLLEDRAAVLWRQHFPTGVWVEQSLQEVIEAHKPQGVTLSFAWEAAKTKQPLQALGLGAEGNEASFLDFLHWVQEQENAGLFYEPATGKYALCDAKPEGGKAVDLPREDVAEVEVHLPERTRRQAVVLNSYVDASTRRKEVDNADKVQGVRYEALLTSTLEDDVTQRATLEGKRQRVSEPELRVRFQRYPTVTLTLQGLYALGADWSAKLSTQGKHYRLYRLRVEARAESEDAADNDGDDTNTYQLEVDAALELQADVTFKRPAFVRPQWPFLAEGRVVSEVGEEEERTWQANQDEKTSLESYRIQLPLWDKQLLVPYDPNLQPGHFFFPVDKGARVLVSLEFRRALLARFLEWRPGAKLAKETQGNHLLMGKKAESETSIQHVYQEAKPLLRIKRVSDKDTQLIEVSEGRLFLEAREEK